MGSGGKQRQTQNHHVVTTPNVPKQFAEPWYKYADDVSKISTNPNDYMVAASPLQMQAWSQIGQPGVGDAAIQQGLSYQPGQLSQTDLNPYLNPYTQNVIDASLADNERGRLMARNADSAQATRAGAFGFSRHGVADAETNGAYDRNALNTVAGLRQANYAQAQQGAMYDINNQFEGQKARTQAGFMGNQQQMERLARMEQMGANQRAIDLQNSPGQLQAMIQAIRAGLLGQIPIGTFTGNTSDGTSTTTSSYKPGLFDVFSVLAQAAGSAGKTMAGGG